MTVNEVTSSDHNLSGSEQSQSDNATPVTREPGIMAGELSLFIFPLSHLSDLSSVAVLKTQKKNSPISKSY